MKSKELKDHSKTRVVIGLSGGVDSSVAAAILKKQGYDVIGLSMKVYNQEDNKKPEDRFNTCCSLREFDDARMVAEKLGIPYYVLNTESAFEHEVIDYFIAEYLRGKTPNPCVKCNEKIKFAYLYRKAKELGADYLATGHYARIMHNMDTGEYGLYGAVDTKKDQSYFLFNLNQEMLQSIMFPLGNMKKEDVRTLAKALNLPTAEKHESQDICFVPSNNYPKFIEERVAPELLQKGPIVITGSSKVVGQHDGLYQYTIGQRKGLKLQMQFSEPLYVVDFDEERNVLFVGTYRDLFQEFLIAESVNWIIKPEIGLFKTCRAKIRYSAPPVDAKIELMSDNRLLVTFDEPQKAVTPGQAVIFMDQEQIIGGGFIAKQRPYTKIKSAALEFLEGAEIKADQGLQLL